MLYFVSVFHFFLLLSSIPLYGYITLSIRSPVGGHLVSSFWLR